MNLIHGHSSGGKRTSEYTAWVEMKGRCLNPNHKFYSHYGGRGIGVYRKWLDFSEFLKDVGNKPSRRHSIHRINNNGNYEPGNVKWVLPMEQSRNTRQNVVITYNNISQCATDWANDLGISIQVLRHRYKSNWPLNKVLQPIIGRWPKRG